MARLRLFFVHSPPRARALHFVLARRQNPSQKRERSTPKITPGGGRPLRSRRRRQRSMITKCQFYGIARTFFEKRGAAFGERFFNRCVVGGGVGKRTTNLWDRPWIFQMNGPLAMHAVVPNLRAETRAGYRRVHFFFRAGRRRYRSCTSIAVKLPFFPLSRVPPISPALFGSYHFSPASNLVARAVRAGSRKGGFLHA